MYRDILKYVSSLFGFLWRFSMLFKIISCHGKIKLTIFNYHPVSIFPAFCVLSVDSFHSFITSGFRFISASSTHDTYIPNRDQCHWASFLWSQFQASQSFKSLFTGLDGNANISISAISWSLVGTTLLLATTCLILHTNVSVNQVKFMFIFKFIHWRPRMSFINN